ncbi:MAG: radical SAM protein [Candidatus Helarchaeota archaeon]
MPSIKVYRFEKVLDQLEKEGGKLSIGECRQLAKSISEIWINEPEKVLKLMKEYVNADNEFVRIVAVHFFKEIININKNFLTQALELFVRISYDWSGKVKNYGLIQTFQELWKSFPIQLKNLLEKTNVNENSSLKIILLRSLAHFLVKSKNNEKYETLDKILLDEIDKNIIFDEPYFISGLISLLNLYGSKFPEILFPYLKKWSSIENANSHYIIQEALSKRLGKVLNEIQVNFLNENIERTQDALFKIKIPLLFKRNYNVIYIERSVQTLLHWINVFFLPFKYGANPFRGCEHGCLYCNARYTHEYLGKNQDTFHNEIIVKINAHKALERDFSTPRWKKLKANLVNLGSVSDPYQPAEKKYEITRNVLKVFLKYENPVCISTKSSLIIRDLDILKELNEKNLLNVMITIPTLDKKLIDRLEINTPSPLKRLEIIKKLKDNSIIVGVLIIPIFPFITDDLIDIENLLKKLSEVKADFAIADVLNFKNEVRQKFIYFLEKNYPRLIEKYEILYSYGKKNEYADKNYLKSIINPIMNKLIKKYNLHHYERMIKGKFED